MSGTQRPRLARIGRSLLIVGLVAFAAVMALEIYIGFRIVLLVARNADINDRIIAIRTEREAIAREEEAAVAARPRSLLERRLWYRATGRSEAQELSLQTERHRSDARLRREAESLAFEQEPIIERSRTYIRLGAQGGVAGAVCAAATVAGLILFVKGRASKRPTADASDWAEPVFSESSI